MASPKGCLEVRILEIGLPAFAWRIPGLKSETWGTHNLDFVVGYTRLLVPEHKLGDRR
jgi:hypothetical protein